MSLPLPSPSTSTFTSSQHKPLSPKEQQAWDAPYIALAQKSNGDLRLLLHSFFSFLHRKTDFYYAHHPDDVKNGVPVKMGFKEGDAEKLLLASFRQYPLRRMPTMSDMQKGAEARQQQQQQQKQEKKQEMKSTQKSSSSEKQTIKATVKENSKEPRTKNPSSSQNNNDKNSNNSNNSKNNIIKKDEIKETIRYSNNGKQIPIGNGGTNFDFNFQWTQTIQEVSIALPLPPNTRAKELDVQIKHDFLSVRTKKNRSTNEKNDNTSKTVFVEGTLKHGIRTDESTWTIEDNVLLVVLDKKEKTWWDCVIVSSSPTSSSSSSSSTTTTTMTETDKNPNRNIIDTSLIDSTSKISEYDQATQGMIRKIIFDQRQERLGLPKSDDILRKDAYERLKNNDDVVIPPPPPPTTTTTINTSSAASSLISSDNIPPLPPGVEFIDKTNFPPT